ncbi:MAG: hypothetical protein ACRDPK_20715, partial [Carbonactinosporaceae bacterium]
EEARRAAEEARRAKEARRRRAEDRERLPRPSDATQPLPPVRDTDQPDAPTGPKPARDDETKLLPKIPGSREDQAAPPAETSTLHLGDDVRKRSNDGGDDRNRPDSS